MAPRAGVTWVAGDLDDATALARLCAGADALIHGAALIKAVRAADFFAVNVGGTRAVLDAARQASVPRLLLLSSLAARAPHLSAYAASKRASEDVLVQDFAQDFAWTVIRAPAVYGPGDRETLKLFKTLRWRLALLPNAAARVSLIHARDLSAGLAASLDAGASHGRILDICDQAPGGRRLADLYGMAAGLLGVRPWLMPVPRGLLLTAGALNEGLGRLTGTPPMLSRGKARELAHPDWVTDSGAHHLCAIANWRPAIGLEAGLAQTLAWYKAHGWL